MLNNKQIEDKEVIDNSWVEISAHGDDKEGRTFLNIITSERKTAALGGGKMETTRFHISKDD